MSSINKRVHLHLLPEVPFKFIPQYLVPRVLLIRLYSRFNTKSSQFVYLAAISAAMPEATGDIIVTVYQGGFPIWPKSISIFIPLFLNQENPASYLELGAGSYSVYTLSASHHIPGMGFV